MIKKLLYCAILFLGLTDACLAESGTKIMAVVGDEVITYNDLQKRFNVIIATNNVQITNDQEAQALSRQVLQALINEKIFLLEAKKLKIVATQEEIDNVIVNIEKQHNLQKGQFDQFLKSKNIAKQDAMSQITNSIIWEKMLEKIIVPQVQVSNAELNEHIEKLHPGDTQIDLYIFSSSENDTKKLATLYAKTKDCAFIEKAKPVAEIKQEHIQGKSKDLSVIVKGKIAGMTDGQKTPIFSNDTEKQFVILCSKKPGITQTQINETRATLLDKKVGIQADYYMKNLSKKTFIEIMK